MNPAGLMTGGRTHQTVVLRGNAGESTGVGITIEPAGGSKSPTTDPLAAVRLPEVRMNRTTRHVAVVGSGVSGLVAAWVLARDSHVTLYEADDRLGGHADTHDVQVGGRTVAVDTGFIVHNDRTYPTLLRLFAELGIATQESDMSMSVRDAETGLEWAGALGASGLFPTRSNLRNPRYLRMLTEIPRFHRMAKKLLASSTGSATRTETLAQFLERGRFTDFFVTYFMTPLVSAVWSTDPDHALDYPARYLFQFLEHHGMLTVFGSPTWRTVTGGSREYVERVAKNLHEVRLSSPVSEIREHEHGVDVSDPSGTATYDAVVVATHPDQALAMLAEPTPLHREVLGAIRYQPNVAAAAHRRTVAAAGRGCPRLVELPAP
jgi:predicted NAD/FAD-binding protein